MRVWCLRVCVCLRVFVCVRARLCACVRVRACVRVWGGKGLRWRGRATGRTSANAVYVCVREREKERARGRVGVRWRGWATGRTSARCSAGAGKHPLPDNNNSDIGSDIDLDIDSDRLQVSVAHRLVRASTLPPVYRLGQARLVSTRIVTDSGSHPRLTRIGSPVIDWLGQ